MNLEKQSKQLIRSLLAFGAVVFVFLTLPLTGPMIFPLPVAYMGCLAVWGCCRWVFTSAMWDEIRNDIKEVVEKDIGIPGEDMSLLLFAVLSIHIGWLFAWSLLLLAIPGLAKGLMDSYIQSIIP